MNGVAQYLVEGGALDATGSAILSADRLQALPVRDALTGDAMENASGQVRFRLAQVPAEEGDADNALFAVRFDGYAGPDEFANQDRATSEFFGWSDSIKFIRHDTALTTASEAARTKLPDIRDRFVAGLGLNEQLQVKAPFPVPGGGSEWMWVEVTGWDGDEIRGLLANEPFNIPDLHSGQMVTVSMGDVFDYLWTNEDGSQEGNSTGKIVETMQGEVRNKGAAVSQ
jgi:uncharacterized protein YegJ (DUF2314 family)